MHHPHEPIMYSGKNIFKNNESPLQCFFKSFKAKINQTQQCTNFIHMYCDVDHERDLTDRRSVKYNNCLFNVNITKSCSRKQIETLPSSESSDTREIYTCVVDQNWIIFYVDQLVIQLALLKNYMSKIRLLSNTYSLIESHLRKNLSTSSSLTSMDITSDKHSPQ